MSWVQEEWWGVTHLQQKEEPSMSKGTPVRTMRVPQPTVDAIERAIDSANTRRFQRHYDWTSWILQAVGEKLRSLERGRNSSRRRRQASGAAPPATTE